jgi:3-deoxy-manno-octulosonate cytidylyltransferase (CMP-KDO synthetase)
MHDTIIIIPSRLASTRLPNKPLADINGKTMIEHVYLRAKEANIADIYIACCDQKLYDHVKNFGANAIMTDPELPSGTDRIHQALTKIPNAQQYKYILNLQGDLPNIAPQILIETINLLKNNDNADISTAVTEIIEEELKTDPNIVKAITSFGKTQTSNKIHYFTRSTAPYGGATLYEHIGIYCYRVNILKKFISLAPSNLENSEKLEQLRALENNMNIYACKIPSKLKPISIDTKSDLTKILTSQN